LAGVRSTCLEAVEGGGTTAVRAIQSLAREEHHLGPALGGHRYHLILGDGHRRHFNLALQLGATMLAVKAVTWDWEFCREIAAVCQGYSSDWLKTLNQMNVLARGGELVISPNVAVVHQSTDIEPPGSPGQIWLSARAGRDARQYRSFRISARA
jgi:hypothetical protein